MIRRWMVYLANIFPVPFMVGFDLMAGRPVPA